MSQNPGFIVGSEFTVSGAATSGGGSFNLTYVAVAGTSGTTIVGNPLSGPIGLPQASSLTGSSTGSGGSMVGVIMPGMAMAGAQGLISPFGTFGSTGTGGVGTYGLTATQATFTFTGLHQCADGSRILDPNCYRDTNRGAGGRPVDHDGVARISLTPTSSRRC